jgi:hypothetical protein
VAECWGQNYAGQAPATRAAAVGSFTAVSAGDHHTCGLRTDGAAECWGDDGGGRATPPATRVAPTATFAATPQAVEVGQAFTLALTGAQVPGFPSATTFTYAFDCGDGTGYGAASAAASASCATAAAGARAVKGKVIDQDGDVAEYTATVAVTLVPQAITVTSALPAGAVVTSAFTLAATGGTSGNPVVFASQTPATCTTDGPDGTALTLLAAGACTVEATQAGSATHAAATPVTLGLTVLSPVQAVTRLRGVVAGSGIKAAVRTGLTDKLDAAYGALVQGQPGAACSQLAAFLSQVQAQRGKAIPAAAADAWAAEAGRIRAAVGC